MSRKYERSTKMELPTVWGNVKCTDGVGLLDGVMEDVMDGVCDGVCDGVWLFGKDSFEECPLTLAPIPIISNMLD